jgi:hypothetical protein
MSSKSVNRVKCSFFTGLKSSCKFLSPVVMLSNSSSDLSGYETMVTPGGSNLFCCSTIVFDALGHIEQNFKPYLGYSSIMITSVLVIYAPFNSEYSDLGSASFIPILISTLLLRRPSRIPMISQPDLCDLVLLDIIMSKMYVFEPTPYKPYPKFY